MVLKKLLSEAVKRGASDLHLVAGIPPTLRINGDIIVMAHDKLSPDDTKKIIYEILNEEQIKKFEENWELNLSMTLSELSRLRINVYKERGNVEAAIRLIPNEIRSLKELGLPKVVEELTRKPNGLILVTGPTGMGKTTTLAAMIDLINRDERKYRIVTIEDPIEYLHEHLTSVIIQREVGNDTKSFNEALRQVLRQDPNVICVGEMRDFETISIALTAAETGHLVFATLHTPDAIQTVNRIVDVFPPYQQEQIRIQLAYTIQGVIAQRLLPRADGKGRVLAVEILIANSAVRNLIREGNTIQIETVITTSSSAGMIPLDKSLMNLYAEGVITYDMALAHAKYPLDFKSFKKKEFY
ncbi:MAG: type IV pilus twitching motility protein PilT [Candidatus Omnitrophota bacterium]